MSQNLFEVIVVDNKSDDNTKDIVSGFVSNIVNLHYVLEQKVGLSHARNRGFYEAKYDWVSYIDDDAKAYPDYVERCLWMIENYSFDCFGGNFLPWYRSAKPKWISKDFGTFPNVPDKVIELTFNRHVVGCVMVFRKSAIKAVGGFPANLGMSGTTIGYGEENWVQNELRKKSYTIGFDPDLKIDHLVAEYKYTLTWHLKRMYAKGKANRIIDYEQSAMSLFLLAVRSIVSTSFQLVRNVPRWLVRKDYYWQNYILDSTGYFLRTFGYLVSKW